MNFKLEMKGEENWECFGKEGFNLFYMNVSFGWWEDLERSDCVFFFCLLF